MAKQWVTQTGETVTAENQRQLGIMTGSFKLSRCAEIGLQPNSLLPVGWKYEQQLEYDDEAGYTGEERKLFVSPTGASCNVGGGEVGGTYGTLILLGAAAAVFYLVWRK